MLTRVTVAFCPAPRSFETDIERALAKLRMVIMEKNARANIFPFILCCNFTITPIYKCFVLHHFIGDNQIYIKDILVKSMAIKARENLIGAWAFLAGVVLAVVVGVFLQTNINPVILGILALLGMVVGYFVSEKDVQTFLLASVALVVVSFSGISGLVINAAVLGIEIGRIVSSVLGTLLVLFVPATIIVALKTVFAIAKS